MGEGQTTERLNKKELWNIFFRQIFIRSALNFERHQAMGFANAMIPVIRKYYKTQRERAEVLKRHMELFLTQPMVSAIPIGIAAAMEERYATKKDIDPESINAVKTALMGPLAALGDSLINGTARPILAGFAAALAMKGSIVGPIIFLIGMTIITLGVRYYGVFKGYEHGVRMVADLQESGLIARLTELAGVAALVVIGGFIPQVVNVKTVVAYKAGDTVIKLQETLDGLIPGILPLGITLFMYYLMTRKRMSPVTLMLLLMLIGVIGVYLKILA
ncbi:PTS system mannose/fructose/sorbose family transporter subunit IID [Thermoanaerobacterium sp. DL9XJH110]|uniref:PTS system mannose/fructose/sorbose family transporter subunit IID n=1 Tax=Thermoanaerobacterium sp. DL9XJH110 TaxID=3386643 RepID=UPI003BB7FA02